MNSQKYGCLNKTCMMRIPAEGQRRWGHLMSAWSWMKSSRQSTIPEKARISFLQGVKVPKWVIHLQAVISRHICLPAALSGLSGLCMWLCAWMHTWIALIKEEVMSAGGNRGKGKLEQREEKVKIIWREYSSMEFSYIKKAHPCLMMEWCQIKST